MVKASKYVS